MPFEEGKKLDSYFKYCPVYDHNKFDDEYSLINLFSNQVTFSRRCNFNDLFDSKVDLIIPNRDRVRRTYKRLSGEKKRIFKQLYMGESKSEHFVELKMEMNKVLDQYLFYCLTDNPVNNLMWSHYANSHNGFCIEWDSQHMKPEKVTYQDHLAKLDILDFIESTIDLRSKENLGVEAWSALKVKLSEWCYEQEYRLHLSNASLHLIEKDYEKFALVKSQPEWIKSIIFGYRMPQETRDYIRSKLREDMVYKEVIIAPNKSSLKLQVLA
ncbi:DUF2971 domain-containing protein [Aliivibrio fischeri]|uniref:DUF2971 domain-containing protein n=2 Tax=Aliivibrio fischeri TaxID=668 RepID=A0A6N3Z3R6_ALIFS|nr:DUF2971 domain-containing protein [Aliivibrio fischeri]MUK45210.1 DUF2971 domain-containing protein [Aliivibrio fischeri]MUK82981.1 DUF2971 domain-containing protein [Aliivibrio fischeri]MUK82988.1 DUF2971 domain-containing protein [Aliivibrio fischeri]